MAAFTVIIIGGSISGLTLANVLEKYGIRYILLEKRPSIGPQLGATVVVHPSGLHLLSQLGLKDVVEKLATPVELQKAIGPDGALLATMNYGELFKDITGYMPVFIARQDLINALYNNLRDKSRVHVSQGLRELEWAGGKVKVTTTDGSSIVADIVVGADGAHSRTRAEIWRIADVEDPRYGSQQLAQSIACTYRCVFGMVDDGDRNLARTAYLAFQYNRAYTYLPTDSGRAYFLGFFKNPAKTVNDAIPRYSDEDEVEDVAAHANDIIVPGLTFGDLHKRRTRSTLVPLQEYLLEKCFYKRVVLIGDAVHKLNPITGRGANLAIEGAALLGDLIKNALDKSLQPTDKMLHTAFFTYQECTKSRAPSQIDDAHRVQSLAALENPILKFMSLKLLKRVTADKLALGVAVDFSTGHSMRYLPQPPRRGMVPLNKDVVANPGHRPVSSTVLWIILMLGMVFLGAFWPKHQTAQKGQSIQVYTLVTLTTVCGLWTVESYRPGFFGTPLCSAVMWAICSMVAGWKFTVPLYFALFIYQTRHRSFFYPDPRAIDIRAAESLPYCALFTFFIVILIPLRKPEIANNSTSPLIPLILPMVTYLGQQVKAKPSQADILKLLYGSRDLRPLCQFYNLLIFFASAVHAYFGYSAIAHSLKNEEILLCVDGALLICLSLTIMVWSHFILWDLCRTNIIQNPVLVVSACLFLGFLTLGPAATLMGLWKWRERRMELARATSRRRK